MSEASAGYDYEIVYGPAADNVIEVWESRSEPVIAQLVVIHGGFWRAAYTRRHVRRLCAALARAGNTVYSIEYGRPGGVESGWPGTFRDVASAVDACVSHAVTASPNGRIVLLGHSAGGHLALWAASRHRLREAPAGLAGCAPPVFAGVIALAGVSDLGLASGLGLGNRAVDQFIGGDPSSCAERFATADPTRLVPTGVPSILIHGELDTSVPLEVSRSYAAAARAAGDRSDVWVLRGTGHLELINPHSGAWPFVLSAIATLAVERVEPV
ncbi:alpha/beta hydrolase family protein [Flindersiella endophytica]